MVGHTLIELLVALGITLTVFSAVLAIAVPASEGFFSLPEHADVQQRLRASVEALRDDVQTPFDGPVRGAPGTVGQAWPAVIPCGRGTDPISGASGPCARNDVVSIVRIDRPLWMATAVDLTSPGDAVPVTPPPGCPPGDVGCGFSEDDPVILADGYGRVDLFVVASGPPGGAPVPHVNTLSGTYPAGSTLSSGVARTYYVREDPSSASRQLRRRDGGSDQPVVDALTGFAIEYFGASDAPVLHTDADGRPHPSYGPEPVPLADESGPVPGQYRASCAFAIIEGQPASTIQPLPASTDGLAALPLENLRDGPWCPDDRSPWRFDLDVVRIRRLRITVRAQAPAPWFRGSHPAWFARPGLARGAGRLVPDVEAVFDLSVRGAGR